MNILSNQAWFGRIFKNHLPALLHLVLESTNPSGRVRPSGLELDLLAAIALIPDGLFVGKIKSYKAGHRLDCELIKQLYLNQVLVPLEDF